jgi:hypothetical protein
MAGRPINPNRPTGLGIGVDTSNKSRIHPSQRYKQNEEAEFRKKILGSLPSIAESTEEIAVDKFRSEGFDEFILGKMDVIGAKNKAQEEARLAKEKFEKEMADAKRKAEEEAAFLDSPKGRMQTMWNDADKRDAILGGIADAMLETRTGVEAYGSRLNQAQKNVRQNLKVAEATQVARAQAALDMQKTAAETNKLNNPAQFMSDTQKEASSIASMEHRLGSPEWKEKYAAELRRIAYKDMLSGPVDGIMAISEYMMKMPNIDPTMKQIYTDIINQLMGSIQGATGGDVTASTTAANTLTHPDLKK